MDENRNLPEPSETINRLRETFEPLVDDLKPENEPAIRYSPEPETK
jgi:hypothetical protein